MKDSWFHPDRIGTYKGQMKNGLAHGKGIYNAKTAQPTYRAFGKAIRRDDDTRNWVYDLPGKPKTYY